MAGLGRCILLTYLYIARFLIEHDALFSMMAKYASQEEGAELTTPTDLAEVTSVLNENRAGKISIAKSGCELKDGVRNPEYRVATCQTSIARLNGRDLSLCLCATGLLWPVG